MSLPMMERTGYGIARVPRAALELSSARPAADRARDLASALVAPDPAWLERGRFQSPWPAGARVEQVAVTADAVTVRVLLPRPFLQRDVTEGWLETVARQFDLAFGAHLPELRAVHLAARDTDGTWKALPAFLPKVDPALLRKEDFEPGAGDTVSAAPLVMRQHGGRTPTAANAPVKPGPAPQPLSYPGALTGRQIFFSQCHGWIDYNTADAWETQRGITNGIVEDFVNPEAVDQYLLRYLENAGASVFTLRESDMNTNMITIDSKDGASYPANGTYVESGNAGAFSNSPNTSWANFNAPYTSSEDPFRVSGNNDRLITTTGSETARATYTPVIPADGFYNVYVCYTRNGAARASDAHYIVYHTGGATHFHVNQERHGWVWVYLGRFHFKAGSNGAVGSVALVNDSTEAGDTVSADAVRFGGGWGDVQGEYHGTLSGHPRWEEGARLYTQYQGASSSVWGAGDVSCRSKFAAWENYGGVEDSVYVSWHSNAFDGTARGTTSYIYSANPPDGTYDNTQSIAGSDELMRAIHDELINDIRAGWDAAWQNRGYRSAYFGEINPSNNNEMPSVLLEVAFHDNATDADALKDPRFRLLLARAVYQGIVKYFATRDGVTPALLPEPPRAPEAHSTSTTAVSLSWTAPLTGGGGLYGDAATSYRVYRSSNGYGFDNGTDTATPSFTLSGLTPGTLYYFKVTALNAGGESLPTEILAVRTPLAMEPKVLVVNGFDRLDRSLLVSQNEPDLGGNVQRMYLDRMNDFSYVIQHATALATAGVAIDSAANEAVTDGRAPLAGRAAVVWITGEESTSNETFSSAEQTLVTTYLNAGGRFFTTGAEIGWDLDWLGSASDKTFFEGMLKCNYAADDAGVYAADGLAGGIFNGVTSVQFDDGTHGTYDANYPDVFTAQSGASTCLRYSTTTSDACVQADTGVYKVVTCGFPFETIWDSTKRAEVMDRVVDFLLPCAAPTLALSVSGVTLAASNPTLTATDSNTASTVTGYNLYRAADPSLSPASWTALLSNALDENGGAGGIQLTDATGAAPPANLWCYRVTAVNARCSLEGP